MANKSMAGAPRGPKKPAQPVEKQDIKSLPEWAQRLLADRFSEIERLRDGAKPQMHPNARPTLPGTVRIGRSTGDGDYPIEIELTDGVSGVEFASVHLRLSDYGDLVSGKGNVPCRLTVGGFERVGMAHEVKTETVMVPKRVKYGDEAGIRAALKPYEIDGWYGNVSDATNSHRRLHGQDTATHAAYNVGFHRHVPASPEAMERAEQTYYDRIRLGDCR